MISENDGRLVQHSGVISAAWEDDPLDGLLFRNRPCHGHDCVQYGHLQTTSSDGSWLTMAENGANLILADWNEKELNGLVEELQGHGRQQGRLAFRKTNVADWNDMVEVFDHGFKTFGVIDAVISNAGVNWGESLLEHNVDPVTDKLKPPSLEGLQINIIGHIYAVNCATYYFAKRQNSQCQIIITSSAAAFLDSPPLHLYSAAKAGLVGMMRSLRHDLPKQGITINVVAPWMTSKYRARNAVSLQSMEDETWLTNSDSNGPGLAQEGLGILALQQSRRCWPRLAVSDPPTRGAWQMLLRCGKRNHRD
ncbi:hypothetical protein AUP68_07569 [Ilyonectria robusta]